MHRLNRQSNCLFPLKKIRSIFKMERIFLYKKISDSLHRKENLKCGDH